MDLKQTFYFSFQNLIRHEPVCFCCIEVCYKSFSYLKAFGILNVIPLSVFKKLSTNCKTCIFSVPNVLIKVCFSHEFKFCYSKFFLAPIAIFWSPRNIFSTLFFIYESLTIILRLDFTCLKNNGRKLCYLS